GNQRAGCARSSTGTAGARPPWRRRAKAWASHQHDADSQALLLLLRQSGLAQAINVFGIILRSAKCSNPVLEVGNTYVGIELEGSGDGFPRLLKPTGESVADCGDSQRDHGIWSLPQRLFGPFHRFGIAAGVEMGERRHALHREHEGIERAQVHGARQVLYRRIWLTTARSPHLSAGVPCGGQVRIESEGPVDDGSGSLEIADDVMKRKPCKSERDRVILAAIRRQPRQ